MSDIMAGTFKIGEEYQARFKISMVFGKRWRRSSDKITVGYDYKVILCVDKTKDTVTFAIPSSHDGETRIRTVPIEHKYPFETAYIPYETDDRFWYKPMLVSSVGWKDEHND